MGLASYVFTEDPDRAWRLLDHPGADVIGLITSAITRADSPFGGMKESDHGKEAEKDVAVEKYLGTKAVSVALEARL
ncbi:putative Aldehyde dehydrogenase domain-containing protein [Seiridium cardinale]